MPYNLIELIACPMCRGVSFSLKAFEEYGNRIDDSMKGHDESDPEQNYNESAGNYKIKTGILFCNSCNRWYPIVNGIHILLPDNYRDEKEDKEFLIKHKADLDDMGINYEKTFNIKLDE
jgi:uncharacterized protein YbaR (Trm112 family)